jgi:hypothetical protein
VAPAISALDQFPDEFAARVSSNTAVLIGGGR